MSLKERLIVATRRQFLQLKSEVSYVIVASPGQIFRLHRAGNYGCWMGRRRDFRDATEFDTKSPTAAITTSASYVGRLRRTTKIASRAKPRRPTRETARSLGMKLWEGRGSGFGPHVVG